MSERNQETRKKIIDSYKKLYRRHRTAPSYTSVGEEIDMSRQRVGQIVTKMAEEEDGLVNIKFQNNQKIFIPTDWLKD